MWEISLIGISLSIFTFINVLMKKEKKPSDIFLFIWLIFLNVPLVHAIIKHLHIDSQSFWFYTNPTLNLLNGPFLYIYILLMTREKFAFKSLQLLHFLPFLIFYVLFISIDHREPMLPGPIHDGFAMGPPSEGMILNITAPLFRHFGFINIVSLITYALIVIFSLSQHQSKISSFFSHTKNQVSLKWMYGLPTAFILLSAANILNETSLFDFPRVFPLTLHLLCHLAFIFLLCSFGIKQQPVFQQDDTLDVLSLQNDETPAPQIPQPNSANQANIEPSRSLDAKQINHYIAKMNAHMNSNKPYLDASFSVYQLAESLAIPRRTLSHILNTELSKNFFQYVNEHRIQEVKSRLENKTETSSILDIALESGFNSKSSFNSLFKKHCNLTPSQYRKLKTTDAHNHPTPSEAEAQ